MSIETVDCRDAAETEKLLAVLLAAHGADAGDGPAPCRVYFRAKAARPDDDEEVRFFAVRTAGRVLGYADLHLPVMDNRHFAYANVYVHPDSRRRGLGRSLVEHCMKVSREAGRRVLNIDVLGTWEHGPRRGDAGRTLLERLGFTLALTEVNRRTDVTAIEPDDERRLAGESGAKSVDYETIAFSGPAPEELLEPLAKLNSGFLSEVPLGDLDLEARRLDVDRMRTLGERARTRGLQVMNVVARPKGGTELAANTVLAVPTEPGDSATQWMTLVHPAHRGHRLGMRVKIENIRQLRSLRPKVRWIHTHNADANTHMASINDALGFTAVDASYQYQIELD